MKREYESPVSSVVAWGRQSVICSSQFDQNNMTEILLTDPEETI